MAAASERNGVDIDLQWHSLPAGRLAWASVGPSDAPLLVALPGLSDGLVPLWAPGMERLRAELRRRRLPIRAHLVSHRDPATEGVTTRDLAADIADLLDHRGEGPVVISGHSMGGMVAQHLAAARPDLVSHLVLTATSMRPDDGMRDVLTRWSRLVAQEDWRGFVADADECAYTGSELFRRRLFARLARPRFDPGLAGRHQALTAACLAHDSTEVVGQITAPTLVVAGADDPVVAPDASRRLAEQIPGARFEELPGLAHGFPEQAPERMTELIGRLVGLDDRVSG